MSSSCESSIPLSGWIRLGVAAEEQISVAGHAASSGRCRENNLWLTGLLREDGFIGDHAAINTNAAELTRRGFFLLLFQPVFEAKNSANYSRVTLAGRNEPPRV